MPTEPTFLITLPPAQSPCNTYFCIRLTPAKKAALHSLAQQLHFPALQRRYRPQLQAGCFFQNHRRDNSILYGVANRLEERDFLL